MRLNPVAMAYGAAIAGGSALWVLGMVLGDRREAWDSPVYWSVCYPLAMVLAAVIAWRVPDRAWRWGLTVMLSQSFVLAVTAAGFSLLPLGIILFGVLALPVIGVAQLVATIRRRRQPASG